MSSIVAYLHTAKQQGAAAAQQLKQLELYFDQQQQGMQLTADPGGAHLSAATTNSSSMRKSIRQTRGLVRAEDRTEELAELQLEVAALRLQLQRRETEVQEMLAREKQLLSGGFITVQCSCYDLTIATAAIAKCLAELLCGYVCAHMNKPARLARAATLPTSLMLHVAQGICLNRQRHHVSRS